MIRSVVGTIGTRVLVQGMNLLVFMLAGHRLGAEGLGAISLIVLGITIVVLLNNVVGGGALVYLAPRTPLPDLLRPAYLWAVITTGAAALILYLIPLVPVEFRWHVLALAALQSIYTIHVNILLGWQRIAVHNAIQVARVALLILVFAGLMFGTPEADVMAYVEASYVAFVATLLLSAWAVHAYRVAPVLGQDRPVLSVMFRQGGAGQAANLLQLLNYRFAYYLIEHFLSVAALGIYSVGNQLAESAWIAPRSLGTVLFARVSNTGERSEQHRITLLACKVAVVLALGVLLVLFLLPEPVYQWFFGPEVVGISPLLLLLAPGIVAMAASQAFSHYFGGAAKAEHNAIGSGLGLVVTVLVGYYLVQAHGLHGAAITASLAYVVNALYQAVVFLRGSAFGMRDLLPGREDVRLLRRVWQKLDINRG